MEGVPHYMLDILEPIKKYSVGDFQRDVDKILEEEEKKDKTVILTGGTGLYINSITEGLSELPASDPKMREEFMKLSSEELYEELKKVDPEGALEIHKNNKKRVERALEVYKLTGEKFILKLLPSGVLHGGTCIIGPGVVVDPKVLLDELASLETRGARTDHVLISDRAHVIMPYHVKLDELKEANAGEMKIGTTKKGIGPCYADKIWRDGIRMVDLLDMDKFAKKLKYNLEAKNEIITKIYGAEPLDYDKILADYTEYANKIRNRIIDTIPVVNKALDEDKLVLFEGAQALVLDINYGTYPFVTSSSPTTGGVTTGAGVSPRKIDKGIGVMKAYTTRVGEGPFVTELHGEFGEKVRQLGGEYGAVTGRPRRCGWMDLVVGKYATMINGLTDIVITKIDVLSGLGTLKICTAYEVDGEIYEFMPADTEMLYRAKPVYEELPGWDEDITQVKCYDDLPENCKKYLKRIEEIVGCPISVVSVGPDRSQNIHIREI